MQQLPNYPPSTNNGVGSQPKNQPTRGNVAAVEPYNHVPHAQSITHNQNFQVNYLCFLLIKKPSILFQLAHKFVNRKSFTLVACPVW